MLGQVEAFLSHPRGVNVSFKDLTSPTTPTVPVDCVAFGVSRRVRSLAVHPRYARVLSTRTDLSCSTAGKVVNDGECRTVSRRVTRWMAAGPSLFQRGAVTPRSYVSLVRPPLSLANSRDTRARLARCAARWGRRNPRNHLRSYSYIRSGKA